MNMLPAWLSDLLPEPAPPATLYPEGETAYIIHYPDGASFKVLTLADANTKLVGQDFTIDDSLWERDGVSKMPFLSFPVTKKTSGILIPSSELDRINWLEMAYNESLENRANYLKDPTDFYSAYIFINSHPAFWTAHDLKKHPFNWETADHCNRVTVLVGRSDGKIVVNLETGAHVEDDYKMHYHDYRLDAGGETYEEAFIELAKMVEKFFAKDGSERSNVDHETPQWVQDLTAQIDDLNDDEPLD